MMNFVEIFILSLVFGYCINAEVPLQPDEIVLKRTRRIVGGDLAEIQQIPYLVNVRRNGVFECGGSLLTPYCVLTAAHCIKDGTPSDFVVRGGVTFLHDLSNSRKVTKIIKPIKYNAKMLEHDLTIFRLESPLQGVNIENIALSEDVLKFGDFVAVSGWGLTSESDLKPSNQVRTVHVRVMETSKCQTLYANYRNVSESMFCASVPGYKDACAADSGGPVVRNNQLVGIVSWGKGHECGRITSPGVYVKISEVKHWIDKIVGKYCY